MFSHRASIRRDANSLSPPFGNLICPLVGQKQGEGWGSEFGFLLMASEFDGNNNMGVVNETVYAPHHPKIKTQVL